MVSSKRAAKKTRPKGKEWRISICAAIVLLLSVICFAPSSYTFGDHNSIHVRGLNGSLNLALQNRPVGSVALSKALRATGSFSQIVHSATISANDLPLAHPLPRMFELDQARFPTSKFADSTIKVRAPPLSLSVSTL